MHVLVLALAVCLVRFSLLVNAEVQCNKTYTWYDWAVDNHGQDPCQLASRLYGSCAENDGLLPLVYTPSGLNYYSGPNSTVQSPCTCSYVMYNLMSACGDCQVGLNAPSAWPTYKNWTSLCARSSMGGLYPKAIPNQFFGSVPVWARFSTEDTGDPRWSYGLSKGVAIGHFLVNEELVAANADGASCPSLHSNKALPVGTAFAGFAVGILMSSLAFLLYRKRRSRVIPPPTRYHTTPDNTPLHPLLPRPAHSQGTSFLRRILEQEADPGHIDPYEIPSVTAMFPPHPAVFPPRRGHTFPPVVSVDPSRSPSRQPSLASLNTSIYGYTPVLRHSQSASLVRPSSRPLTAVSSSPIPGPSGLSVHSPTVTDPSTPNPPDVEPIEQPPAYRRKS